MKDIIYPYYGGGSLLNVPATVLAHFGVKPTKPTLPKEFYKNIEEVNKIVLLFIDGFGDSLLQKVGMKQSFFHNLTKNGIYNKITSLFPSTTAASITAVNSGLSPLEHGLPEWYLYFEELGCIIQTLPFIPVLETDREKLQSSPPGILFNNKTIYQQLQEARIPSYMFLHQSYAGSLYNQTASVGSQIITYSSLDNLIVNLRNLLVNTKHQAYFYVYWSGIDASEHQYGPWTDQVAAEISMFSHMIQEEFINKIDSKTAVDTGIFFTSDHGQIPTDPDKTIYLDEIEGFDKLLKKDYHGNIIPPSGSARDVFLNIADEKLNFALDFLQQQFGSKAQVLKTEQVIKDGLFGEGVMHPKFKSRVGNLLVLPTEFNTIWYHFSPEMKFSFKGYHGGLSKDEMIIPFISARISNLKH